ncbi:MAG: hypothetical protein GY697_24560 [Desulfobacterales bacterium]|nr:hypothetical protein [Desulfobacterales bacterium]
MIELASEATVQQVTRADQNQAFSQKDTVQHETQKVLADRPVEKSEESAKAKDAEKKDEIETRYNLENNRIIIEKYDENGDLILQMPPVHTDEA